MTNAELPLCAVCGHGYAIPVRKTSSPADAWLQIGATFQRGISGQTVIADDNSSNIASLGSLFAGAITGPQTAALAERPGTTAWAATRATTPDRLPCVGAVPDAGFYAAHYHDLQHGRHPHRYPVARYVPGLYLNTGHGSRGLLTTALAADMLAAIIAGVDPSSTETAPKHAVSRFNELLHPARFWIRQFRKNPYNCDTAAAIVAH